MSDVTTQTATEARRTPELIVALACLVLGVSIAHGASQIPVAFEGAGMGPREWPLTMGIGIAVLAVLLLLRAVLGRPAAAGPEGGEQLPVTRQGVVRLLIALALLAAYVATWKHIPFAVATPVLVAAMLIVNGERRWRTVALVTVLVAAVLIGLFQFLLRVPL